jgi:hypothetical protein
MFTPAQFASSYANLFTWFWRGDSKVARRAPIVSYLQHNDKKLEPPDLALRELKTLLASQTHIHGVNERDTFNFNGYDYINNSIKRCFIGKACPWEIQETLQLASQVGAVSESGLLEYCRDKLGVDCGGFVANYWGEGCPHMVNVKPAGWDGILPRNFWADAHYWPDVMSRRRQSADKVAQGDAAIFFKDVKNNNPDIVKQRDSNHKLIQGTGSEAFHIGVVESAEYSGENFTKLEIADSSGMKSKFGGNGVNVRLVGIQSTGKSGKWVYCQCGAAERIYFVAPPAGWGPETAYTISGDS